jgi:hypothetical protein
MAWGPPSLEWGGGDTTVLLTDHCAVVSAA